MRAFYKAAVQKTLQKSPFSDTVLKDLVILDHRKRKDLDNSQAVYLAERFHFDIDQEELKEEWTDFQLMTDEQLPSLQQDKLVILKFSVGNSSKKIRNPSSYF